MPGRSETPIVIRATEPADAEGIHTLMSCPGVTYNTLQLGAIMQRHPDANGAALNGHLSFDRMMLFSEFEVGISGSVSASCGRRGLVRAEARGAQSGIPRPAEISERSNTTRAARSGQSATRPRAARVRTADPSLRSG